MSRNAGLTLAEVVVAVFIFAAGGLACFTLLLTALRNASRVEKVAQGTLIAENVVERIRSWACSPGNYLTGWSIYDDKDHSGWEGFTVHTSVTPDQRHVVSLLWPRISAM